MKIKKDTLIYIISLLALWVIVACSSNSGNGHTDLQITMDRMPLLNDAQAHGEGVGWERADCLTCHPAEALGSRHPRLIQLAGLTADESCMACHLGNGADGRFNIPLCIECHTSDAFENPVHTAGYTTHAVTGSAAKVMGNMDCLVCHDSTDMNGIMDYSDLSALKGWNRGDIQGFCLSCHSAGGADTQAGQITAGNMADKYAADYHGNAFSPGGTLQNENYIWGEQPAEVSCLSCHLQHASSNWFLIIESGAQARVVTDDTVHAAKVTVNSADYRDLCAVCHSSTIPASSEAANGLKQIVHKDYCFICHDERGMRPASIYPVGYGMADSMMETGSACGICHAHGANLGTHSLEFPEGRVHSAF